MLARVSDACLITQSMRKVIFFFALFFTLMDFPSLCQEFYMIKGTVSDNKTDAFSHEHSPKKMAGLWLNPRFEPIGLSLVSSGNYSDFQGEDHRFPG